MYWFMSFMTKLSMFRTVGPKIEMIKLMVRFFYELIGNNLIQSILAY